MSICYFKNMFGIKVFLLVDIRYIDLFI